MTLSARYSHDFSVSPCRVTVQHQKSGVGAAVHLTVDPDLGATGCVVQPISYLRIHRGPI